MESYLEVSSNSKRKKWSVKFGRINCNSFDIFKNEDVSDYNYK